MSDILFENTSKAAYFLWEYTQGENALALWTCAEDIAYYLEVSGIFSAEQMKAILKEGVYSTEYIFFVRHLAYRIYIYNGNEDSCANWYASEKLINNDEWCNAITQIAKIYYDNKGNFDTLSGVRSEQVKLYHSSL